MRRRSPKRWRDRTCASFPSRPTTSSILQALHRVRDRLVHRRTAVINQIRGFLLERGITFAKGPANLRNQMPAILEDAEQNITPRMRTAAGSGLAGVEATARSTSLMSATRSNASPTQDAAASGLRADPRSRAAGLDRHGCGHRQRRRLPQGTRLRRLARAGAASALHRGQAKLYGISKRGNIYLRRMFIHGARAVLFRVKYDTGGFGQWVHQLEARAPRNKVVVAIANKLARIAWAVLFRAEDYRHMAVCSQA